ncbi:MAG: hypothetical protein JW878_04440 [Methanomicrobia archaeon]|nr:hypothetical protein [Methanomicrobia archaeon]
MTELIKISFFMFWCLLAAFYFCLFLISREFYEKIKDIDVTRSLSETGQYVFGNKELGKVGIAEAFRKLSQTDMLGFLLASLAAFFTGITIFSV